MFRISILLVVCALLLPAQPATYRWIHQVGGSGNQTLAGLAVDSQGNTYAAGTTTSLDFPVQNAVQARAAAAGLLRIDGPGANWQNLYQSGLTAAGTVVVDPRNPQIVYAAGVADLRKSTDGGVTWTVASTQTISAYDGLAIDPTNSNTIYAGAYQQGLVKSTDGGATWASINSGIATPTGAVAAARSIWVDPNHPAVLFATVITNDWVLARSVDAGATWQLTAPGALGLVNLSFDPFTDGKVYAAAKGGPLVSTDDGVTWTILATVAAPTSQPTVILPDPAHAGILYAGAPDALWKSTDGGATWTKKVASTATMLAADPGTGAIYAAFGYHVVVTTDGFDTTAAIGPPSVMITSLAPAGGHVFAGTQGSTDVWVAKYDPQGNAVFATYFGGTASDIASAIAVDAGGGVYVTGTTQSLDFPVTSGAYAKSGSAFVFKLNPDGSLAWSTYFAAPPNAIAVDGAGHAFIAGISGGNMPTTPGAYQPTFDGMFCGLGCLISFPPTNGFLAEFDAAGASLLFSTYLGTQTEGADAVMVLPDGSPLVAGQSTLYHLDPTGSSLAGKKTLAANMRWLAPDGAGNILLAGETRPSVPSTTPGAFATTPGVFQQSPYPGLSLPGGFGSNSGFGDAFVMRLDPQLNVRTSTLLGGEASDVALGAVAGPGGTILVAGSTYSQAFPTRGALQNSFDITTGFLSQLSGDFSTVLFSTYAGDAQPFYVRTVAATPDGGVVFGGSTSTVPYVAGGFLGAYASNAIYPDNSAQAFVARLDIAQPSSPRIDSVVNAASQLGVPLSPGETIQVRGGGFGADAVLQLNGTALPLLSQSSTTLTAAMPTDFSASASTIEVDSGGGKATILVSGAAVSPGIFSQDGSGIGGGFIFNKDGTLNTPTNPAKEGDPITICATGVGTMTFDQGYAVTDSPVDVFVDGFYANGIAAILGPVAGLPGNVYQISVFVPRPSDYAASNPNLNGFVMPPQVAVTLRVKGVYSQAGLALYVTH
ncbi:MAG TPA: SBBP repeat-containing protein [Candidatus Sulfopaludibacter sp.]|nr:SBBP repeat-containing protein [Candidatus Sulfopaludibacter sp.]